MSNLKLSELASTAQGTPGDKIYLVQSSTSRQIDLSAFFDNIPTDVNIETTSQFKSGGDPIGTVFDASYAQKLSKPVIELQGAVVYPTPGEALSASGNATVVLSTGNTNYIPVTLPKEGEGAPADNWEVEFIQTGPAQIYVVATDTDVTLVGSGSAAVYSGGALADPVSLSSHMTPGLYGSLTIKKLDTNNGTNRYLALTASQGNL
jgi:hypothetical protein